MGWGAGGCSSGWGVTHHGDQRVLTRRTASSSSPRPRQMPRDPHATSCHSSLLAHTRATHTHEGSPHTQIYSERPRGTGVVSEEDAYGNTGKDTHGTGLFPGERGRREGRGPASKQGWGTSFHSRAVQNHHLKSRPPCSVRHLTHSPLLPWPGQTQ